MYFACFSTLLIFGCFVQNGLCTNCTLDQMGAEVPASACDISKCKTVTIDQLNAIKNNEVLASTWNLAPIVLVSICPLTYNFDAQPDTEGNLAVNLNISIKYGWGCSQITYFPLQFTSKEEAGGGYKIFETNDGDVAWELCFPYLVGSDFIYRRCRTPPAEKEFATILVYEVKGGRSGKPDIVAAANSLSFLYSDKVVDCL